MVDPLESNSVPTPKPNSPQLTPNLFFLPSSYIREDSPHSPNTKAGPESLLDSSLSPTSHQDLHPYAKTSQHLPGPLCPQQSP